MAAPFLLRGSAGSCGGDCVCVHTNILQGSTMMCHFQTLGSCIQMSQAGRSNTSNDFLVVTAMLLLDEFGAPWSWDQWCCCCFRLRSVPCAVFCTKAWGPWGFFLFLLANDRNQFLGDYVRKVEAILPNPTVKSQQVGLLPLATCLWRGEVLENLLKEWVEGHGLQNSP